MTKFSSANEVEGLYLGSFENIVFGEDLLKELSNFELFNYEGCSEKE